MPQVKHPLYRTHFDDSQRAADSACNGYVRPGVVWFGEMLPEDAWSVGLAAAEGCDVFLSIGTSGIVYPAA